MADRISLIEAYDNRDVIAQLIRLRDDVNGILAILENIDPSGDLTNYVTKTGDEVISGIKTFTGKIVADCDIIQNGAAYETHAEQVFTTKDYIKMREGAIAALAPGDLSGIEIENYDGNATDCRLAVDASGVARVGDAGDEQPLMTRDESADMTSGNFVLWDGVNNKAITSSLGPEGVIKGSGNIGDNTHPVKIVDGAPVPVDELEPKLAVTSGSGTGYSWVRYGRVVFMNIGYNNSGTGAQVITATAPKNVSGGVSVPTTDGNGSHAGRVYMSNNGTTMTAVCLIANAGNYTSFAYLTE